MTITLGSMSIRELLDHYAQAPTDSVTRDVAELEIARRIDVARNEGYVNGHYDGQDAAVHEED